MSTQDKQQTTDALTGIPTTRTTGMKSTGSGMDRCSSVGAEQSVNDRLRHPQHFTECYMNMYPDDEGVYCTCLDWSPDI